MILYNNLINQISSSSHVLKSYLEGTKLQFCNILVNTAWGSKIEGLVFCEFFNEFSNIGWWTMFRMLNTIVLYLMRPLRVMSTSIRPHSIKISEATRKLKKLSLFSNGGYEVSFVWAIIESICGLYFALLMKFLGMIGQQI